MRKAIEIRDKELINELLSLTEDDCLTLSTIMNLLGDFGDGEKCKPYDYFLVPANTYGKDKKNKKAFYTTVGLWIFNKGFIEQDLFDIFQYIDEPITKKYHGKINKELSYAIMEDKISLEVLKRFEMKVQKFMPLVSVLSASYTDKMLTISSDINKKKKELLKKYDQDIKNNDPKIMNQIEAELLDYAKDLLKDDPSMDMFNSGARASFGNNFKNMFVSKGAIKNPDPDKGGYDLVTSSYMDGITKEEYPAFAASLSAGPYSRAKKTETGGYWEKLFLKAFQHLKLLPQGSDCGTTKTLKVYLTEKNIDEWMYSYIVDGSKLVELTSDNRNKYINKEVKFRFSALCQAKDGYFCNKCVGNLFYRLEMVNIGAATPQIPSKIKNLLMKKFHDSVINFSEIDIEKAFGFKK